MADPRAAGRLARRTRVRWALAVVAAAVIGVAGTAWAGFAGKARTAVPEPGGSASASSQLPGGASKVEASVSSSEGNLDKSTVVAEGEELRRRAGEAVAACWLIGPDAVPISNRKLKALVDSPQAKETFANAGAARQLKLCVILVHAILADSIANPSGKGAASRCRSKRVALVVRRRRGRIVDVEAAPSQKIPRTAVRYRCRSPRAGRAELAVSTRRRGGLRKQLGSRLDIGLVRAPDAEPADGQLTFGFGGQ